MWDERTASSTDVLRLPDGSARRLKRFARWSACFPSAPSTTIEEATGKVPRNQPAVPVVLEARPELVAFIHDRETRRQRPRARRHPR